MVQQTTLDRVGTATYGESGFRFEYQPATIHFGRGCVSSLTDEFERAGVSRALVVTGTNVGANEEVMGPVREALGDHVVGVFAETTPDKRLATAYEAAETFHEYDADAIVAVGSGSTIDVTGVARVLAGRDVTHEEAAEELADGESDVAGLRVPDDADLPPGFRVPTTFAGSALSQASGVEAAPDTDPVDEPLDAGVSDRRMMAESIHYDPDLVETTPTDVLAGSAMNGLNKPIETLFARNATPITDATALQGLRLCRQGAEALGSDDPDPRKLEQFTLGIVLGRYGTSRPEPHGDGHTFSLVHGFGHGFNDIWDGLQGEGHAAFTPAVLRYLFENVNGRRELLAEVLGPAAEDPPEDPAEAVVAGVEAIRDDMGLPERIRDLHDHPPREQLRVAAESTVEDSFTARAPSGLNPTVDDVHAVFEEAY